MLGGERRKRCSLLNRRKWRCPLEEVADQLGARRHVELAVELSQVVVDRAWTDEQLRGDLVVRKTFRGQFGHPSLLRCEVVAPLWALRGRPLPPGHALRPCSRREVL